MKEPLKNLLYFLLSPFIVRRGEGESVYITFDDGPHPVNTPLILEILDQYECKATFFMLGQEAEHHLELVKDILAREHKIGFHSYAHASNKNCSFDEFKKDFKNITKIENALGEKINLYRPPYGDMTLKVFIWLVFARKKTIMWSLDSRDSFDDEEDVLKTVSPVKISAGEIILFHDDYNMTVKLLPEILKRIRDCGIECKAIT